MISRRLDRLQSPHFVFFFNDTATTEIYTLSLHDALPISTVHGPRRRASRRCSSTDSDGHTRRPWGTYPTPLDRKSTRLNSSHSQISYAVFCLKKKKKQLIGPNAACTESPNCRRHKPYARR